jgi:hypothetical protein
MAEQARLAADEYQMAATAWANMMPPAEAAAHRPALVAQAARQAAALRELAEFMEGIARLDASMQLSLGIDVLPRPVPPC